MNLLLLDPISGRPVGARRKKSIPADAVAEDYLNILILTVEYSSRLRPKVDRMYAVRQLYKFLPFAGFLVRDKVNVFTPKTQPILDPVHKPGVNAIHFKKLIEPIVQTYQYGSFIEDGNPWLWSESSAGPKRSKGCIGILAGVIQELGSFYQRLNPIAIPPWAKEKGAVQQSIGYFGLASKIPHSSDKEIRRQRRRQLGRTFVHELGHALNLDDEYESPITGTDTGIFRGYAKGGEESPNIISKDEILEKANSVAEGVWPSPSHIDRNKIPWSAMIDRGDPIPMEKHYSRTNISPAFCAAFNRTFNAAGGFCQLHDLTSLKATGKIGLYEGGDLDSFDVYRPDRGCRMKVVRTFNQGFCAVCREWIKYRINDANFKETREGFKAWLARRYP